MGWIGIPENPPPPQFTPVVDPETGVTTLIDTFAKFEADQKAAADSLAAAKEQGFGLLRDGTLTPLLRDAGGSPDLAPGSSQPPAAATSSAGALAVLLGFAYFLVGE